MMYILSFMKMTTKMDIFFSKADRYNGSDIYNIYFNSTDGSVKAIEIFNVMDENNKKERDQAFKDIVKVLKKLINSSV